MLAEMECECQQLPEGDVVACIKYVKSLAADLDVTRSEDREKLSHELRRYFASPGTKYSQAIRELQLSKAAAEEDYKRQLTERESTISRQGIRIQELESHVDRQDKTSVAERLRRSALIRALLCLFAFMASEVLVGYWVSKDGAGKNLLQRTLNSWHIVVLPIVAWGIFFVWIEGEERLKRLGWPFERIVGWFWSKGVV